MSLFASPSKAQSITPENVGLAMGALGALAIAASGSVSQGLILAYLIGGGILAVLGLPRLVAFLHNREATLEARGSLLCGFLAHLALLVTLALVPADQLFASPRDAASGHGGHTLAGF